METSVNRLDSQALTLVVPPKDNPEIDPLAVLHLTTNYTTIDNAHCEHLSMKI